jgi:DNA-binding LacI/PurR family transcriptional regulator
MRKKKEHSPYATLCDVAQKADVSISTVSRVVNNLDKVDEYTRRRVQGALQELNYKPNISARGLSMPRHRMIQMFYQVGKFPLNFETNWFRDTINGAGEYFRSKNYHLMINMLVGLIDAEEFYSQAFYDGSLEGILLVAPHLEDKDILKMTRQRIPIVLMGHRIPDPSVSYVDTDNRRAVGEAVDHLVELGHKRIACLAGPIEFNRNAQDRLEGFKDALQKHGLEFPENYLIKSNFFSRDVGMEGMARLLTLKERPTAVVCANDLIALGAWDQAQKEGLQIGKDISIVGYDDIPAASTLYSLTTVRQDFWELSAKAAELLIEKIENPSDTTVRQILIPSPVIIRKSTGPVPA